jgi:hypothetical protein
MELTLYADAFHEPLRAVNPYINDIIPSFHYFLSLPIELRYIIYKHYFNTTLEALACNNWPNPYTAKNTLVAYLTPPHATGILIRTRHDQSNPRSATFTKSSG